MEEPCEIRTDGAQDSHLSLGQENFTQNTDPITNMEHQPYSQCGDDVRLEGQYGKDSP